MKDGGNASTKAKNDLRERSTAEKVSDWAAATRHTIVFYDLVKSFGPSPVPSSDRRVICGDKHERPRLGNAVWQAGHEAVCFLLENISVKGDDLEHALTVHDLNEAYPKLHEEAEDFLDRTFYPDMLQAMKDGLVESNVSADQFSSLWPEYKVEAKAMVFLDLVGGTPIKFGEVGDNFCQLLAAIAILEKIDDCVLSSMNDGAWLDEEAIALGRLRTHLKPPYTSALEMKDLKRLAMSERGAELAKRRHQKTNDARSWVLAEWAAHASAYEGNKSAFSRDYVRLVRQKFDAQVTEKQMREVWLKDTPSASKPDGMPANGE